MSRDRRSTGFASTVREQGIRKAAGPVAALEPRGGSGARPKDSYAVAVELELHLGTRLEAELLSWPLGPTRFVIPAVYLGHLLCTWKARRRR